MASQILITMDDIGTAVPLNFSQGGIDTECEALL
jgi:hypothetical protein